MRTSCVQHPPDEPIAILRKSYIEICDGDRCAAMLLSNFEYWHNVKLRSVEQEIALANEDPTHKANVELWVYKKQTELQEELLGEYGLNKIGTGCDLLISKGYVATRPNPSPLSRTKHFLFRPDKVNAALQGGGRKGAGSESLKVKTRVVKSKDTSRYNGAVESLKSSSLLNTETTFTETTSQRTGSVVGSVLSSERVISQSPQSPPRGNDGLGEQANQTLTPFLFSDTTPGSPTVDTPMRAPVSPVAGSGVPVVPLRPQERHQASPSANKRGFTNRAQSPKWEPDPSHAECVRGHMDTPVFTATIEQPLNDEVIRRACAIGRRYGKDPYVVAATVERVARRLERNPRLEPIDSWGYVLRAIHHELKPEPERPMTAASPPTTTVPFPVNPEGQEFTRSIMAALGGKFGMPR